MNLEKLKAPFSSDKIKWRIGVTTKDKSRGLALAYIDSRTVMDRLDEIVGIGNWQREHCFGNNEEILCSIGIRVNNEWVWKEGGASRTDFEAVKGGLSDAFKRAAVSWGIGRYLYHLPNMWVPIEKKGKSYVIKEGYNPKLPDGFLPDNERGEQGKYYIDQIRSIYQQQPKAVGNRIIDFLKQSGFDPDFSNVGKLNNIQAKELVTMLRTG